MTYALAWPLQEGIYQCLTGDAAVSALVGSRIYDAALPKDAEPEPDGVYLTLGDEVTRDWSTATDQGAAHLVTVSVHAPRHGFSDAKIAAGAVSDALLNTPVGMSRGRVVLISFVDARTRRTGSALRRIDLRFRVITEDTV